MRAVLSAQSGPDNVRLSEMGGLGTSDSRAVHAAIAYNGDDNEYLVVWEGSEAATDPERIYGQRVNAGTGEEIESDLLLAQVPGDIHPNKDATYPAVVYNSAAQQYLVVFVGEVNPLSTEPEVFGQFLNRSSTPVGDAFQISECGAPGDTSADVGATVGKPLDVALNEADNEYLVVWRCDDVGDNGIVNGEFEIFGRIVDDGGALLGSGDFQISQSGDPLNGVNTEYDAESPAVAWNSNANEYLVTWGGDNPLDGDNIREVYGQRLDSDGAEIGMDFAISHESNGDSDVSDVAYNPAADEYLVVWQGDRVSDDVHQIHGQRLAGSTGMAVGAEDFAISQNGMPAGGSQNPAVLYNSVQDEYLVTWSQPNHPAAPGQIYTQRVTPAGDEIGVDDQPVSSMAFGIEGVTSVAFNVNTGAHVVAWSGSDSSDGQVSGEYEIFAYLDFAPTVVLTSAAPEPTDTSPIPVSVAFSEDVAGFTAGDIVVSNAAVDNFSGNGASFTFELVPLGDGLVTAGIPAGVAEDSGGKGNLASAQFSRTFDTNAPPVANADNYSTDEDAPLVISAPGVLDNDSDPDNDPLTTVEVSGPGNGVLVLNSDGSFNYTPDANFTGSDSFTYQASDGEEFSNVATVTITVIAVNDAPVASDDSYSTNEDTPLVVAIPGVLGNDSDIEDDTLTAVEVSGPGNGVLVLNSDGSFSYTPDANFNGSDSFTYQASDGVGESNVATVTLTVLPLNDPPVVSIAGNAGACTGSSTGVITLVLSDPDSGTDSLSLTGSTSNPSVVPQSGITFAGSGATRTVTISSNSGSGVQVATVTLQVSDGQSSSTLPIVVRDGGNGIDNITGGSGADLIFGGNGNDTLAGGDGPDLICGGNGKDSLNGEGGDDSLDGGNGNDEIDGGPGNDFLKGGNGNDTMTGGSGADHFDGGNGSDDLMDYNSGAGDTSA